MTDVDQEVEFVAKPLHNSLHLPLGVEILLAASSRLWQSQLHLGLLTCRFASAGVQRRGVPCGAATQIGHHTGQPPNHGVETDPHRGQMGRMPQDVQKPRQIPVMRNLGLGLHTKQPTERGIASQFGQTAVIRGMPQQGGQHGDAPEDGDRIVVPSMPPRLPQSLQQGSVGDSLQTTADRLQGGRILERCPSKQRLRGCDPHSRDVSSTRALVYIAIDTPCKGGMG